MNFKIKYLCPLLLFFNYPAYGQFDYRETVKKTDSKKIYRNDFDFQALDCGVMMSSLVGEEIYFARRFVLPTGKVDSIPPFTNMFASQATPLSELLEPATAKMLEDAFYGAGWSIRDITMKGRCRSSRYADNKSYSTLMYKPHITAWSSSRVLEINTPYAEVENKFFKIIECHDSALNDNGYCWMCFTLKDTDGLVFNWIFPSRMAQDYTAHFKNYLIRQKKDYAGRKFYVRNDVNIPQYCTNVADDSEYALSTSTPFECTDLTFVKRTGAKCGAPYFIFKDAGGRELGVNPARDARDCPISYFWTEDEYTRYLEKKLRIHDSTVAARAAYELKMEKERKDEIKRLEIKYGKANAQLILRGQVKLGLSMVICKESWGEPAVVSKSVHREIITETWRYDIYHWLRFTDGVLTAYSE